MATKLAAALTEIALGELRAANIREDIHNLTVARRRISLMLSGDLKIPTTATPEKLRGQIADIDAAILRLRIDLAALQP